MIYVFCSPMKDLLFFLLQKFVPKKFIYDQNGSKKFSSELCTIDLR